MPPAAVMPVLDYDDVAAAIGWLGAAFGFTERWRAQMRTERCSSSTAGR